MKKLHSFAIGLAMITAALISIGGSPQDTASAATKDTKTTGTYTYIAQEGDSYSQFARKAIQTYGITEKVKLSPAQIIFAETNLTQAASSPYLELGQKTSLKKSDVKSWVEKAQKLTDDEKAAWATYALYVDFDTNRVGES